MPINRLTKPFSPLLYLKNGETQTITQHKYVTFCNSKKLNGLHQILAQTVLFNGTIFKVIVIVL